MKWGRWEWLLFALLIMAGRSIFDSGLPLVRLAVFAAVVGAIALWAGRDNRERWTGVLAGTVVLAAGLMSIRQLSPGRALLAVATISAAVGGVLVAWHMRRTPMLLAKEPFAGVSVVPAAKPLPCPVVERCRWCGQRPVAVVCGRRSDGGPCETAEAAASELAAKS